MIYTTLLSRTPGDYDVVLRPFTALMEAKKQPELYREMLMNVFLFFPPGLALSNALPRKWHRWIRIILTTFVGCILSACIEYAQFRFALGTAEVDDVICNTLGAFVGAISLVISYSFEHAIQPAMDADKDVKSSMSSMGGRSACTGLTS